MATAAARVHVLLSQAEADRLDGYCRDRGFKKSTLIARLVREYLDREQYPAQRGLFEGSPANGRGRPR